LWLAKDDPYRDSLEKFWGVLDLCRELEVHTDVFNAESRPGADPLWVVPLFSWYTKPEEGTDSLYVAKAGDDPTLSMWNDNYLVQWPSAWAGRRPADYFLKLNNDRITP